MQHLPDGFVFDNDWQLLDILKIKRPESKKHLKSFDLIWDPNFYVKLKNDSPVLKQKHRRWLFFPNSISNGIIFWYLQAFPFCDFVVYNFKELILIIIGTKFNELYFHKRLNKLNTFYKDYMLLKICESDQQFQAFRHRPSLQIKRQLKIDNNYGRKISGRAVGAVGARRVYQRC